MSDSSSEDQWTTAAESQRKIDAVRKFLLAEDAGESQLREELLARDPENARLLGSFLEGVDAIDRFFAGEPPGVELPDEILCDQQLAGRYRFVSRLGQGMFGAVWKAWDEQLQREG